MSGHRLRCLGFFFAAPHHGLSREKFLGGGERLALGYVYVIEPPCSNDGGRGAEQVRGKESRAQTKQKTKIDRQDLEITEI
jgi:hypothetical protein